MVKPLYASENVCEFFGYTKEEWIPLTERYTPLENFVAYSEAAYEEFAELLRRGEAEFSYFDYQIIDLFNHLDDFLQKKFTNIYLNIHDKLIIDYYSFFKVKPKPWRSISLSKEEKQEFYPLFTKELNNYSIEDLYRYANVLKLSNMFFIIFYKEHQNKIFFIN